MLTLTLALAFLAPAQDSAAITQTELLRRTQLLYDAVAPGNQMTITTHDNKLFAQRGIAKPTELLPESPDLFFRAGVEGRRLFHRNPQGIVDLLIDRRNNEDMIWKKVN